MPSTICLLFEEMKIITNEKPFFKVTLILVVYDSKNKPGRRDLIFCAIYLAPHVKERISTEGALSRPTDSDHKKGGFHSVKRSAVDSASLVHPSSTSSPLRQRVHVPSHRWGWGETEAQSKKQSLFLAVTKQDARCVQI